MNKAIIEEVREQVLVFAQDRTDTDSRLEVGKIAISVEEVVEMLSRDIVASVAPAVETLQHVVYRSTPTEEDHHSTLQGWSDEEEWGSAESLSDSDLSTSNASIDSHPRVWE